MLLLFFIPCIYAELTIFPQDIVLLAGSSVNITCASTDSENTTLTLVTTDEIPVKQVQNIMRLNDVASNYTGTIRCTDPYEEKVTGITVVNVDCSGICVNDIAYIVCRTKHGVVDVLHNNVSVPSLLDSDDMYLYTFTGKCRDIGVISGVVNKTVVIPPERFNITVYPPVTRTEHTVKVTKNRDILVYLGLVTGLVVIVSVVILLLKKRKVTYRL